MSELNRNHNGGAFCSEKPEVAENQAKDQSDETTDETFFRQGIEGLAVRCQKGEGGIAVKNILYLTSEVAKSSLSTSPG